MEETLRTTIEIPAAREAVFDHFVRAELLLRWMADSARLEARQGGRFAVDVNGSSIRGYFARIERPDMVEVAWGEAGNDIMPPGSTRVLVSFKRVPGGTRVELEHVGVRSERAKQQAAEWRHFLNRLRRAAGKE